MNAYTLKQLEGLIACDCGSKYWGVNPRFNNRICCVSCNGAPPSKPKTTCGQVKSNFAYARSLMTQTTKILAQAGRNDDPRLGSEIDIDELSILANELNGAAATLSQYVIDRGGVL